MFHMKALLDKCAHTHIHTHTNTCTHTHFQLACYPQGYKMNLLESDTCSSYCMPGTKLFLTIRVNSFENYKLNFLRIDT
jgi:hypothetical protein